MSNFPLNDDGELPFPDDSEKPKKRPPSRWWQKTYIPIPLLIATCLLLICSAVLLLTASFGNGSPLCNFTSFCTDTHRVVEWIARANDPRPPLSEQSIQAISFDSSNNAIYATLTPPADASPRCDPSTDYRDHLMFTLYWQSNTEIFVSDLEGKTLCRVTDNLIWERMIDWSPDRSRILFTAQRSGDEHDDIYVMDFDGTNIVDLTSDGFNGSHAKWSPDSTQIAFSAAFNESLHVFVVNADGSNRRDVTPDNLVADYPTWSPDGSRLAYWVAPESNQGNGGIFVVDVANPENVSQFAFYSHVLSNLAWSPDSASIVASAAILSDLGENQGDDLIRMDAAPYNEKLRLTRLTDASQPSWSPDGQQLVFVSRSTLQILDLASNTIKTLPISNELQPSGPVWR